MTEPPVKRHKSQDLNNRQTKVTQMSTLIEVEKENVTAEEDDQMPQLFSQASTKHREEPEDAVTSIISSTDRPSGPLLKETNKHDEFNCMNRS